MDKWTADMVAPVFQDITGWLALYGLKILAAIFIILIGIPVAKILVSLLRRGMVRAKVDPALVSFLSQLIYYGLLLFLFVAALNKLGLQTASIVAVLGAAALAVSLSLQSNLSSLASGVLLLVFRPFKIGDFIEAGGIMGTVEEIGLMTTRLKSFDGKEVIVPNTKVFNNEIVNYSAKPTRRIDLVFGISYEDDIRQAKEIIWDVLKADDRVLADPAPQVMVIELEDNSVNIGARPWVKSDDYWTTRCDMLEKIKIRFDTDGITIPYPQRDIHHHYPEGPVPEAKAKISGH